MQNAYREIREALDKDPRVEDLRTAASPWPSARWRAATWSWVSSLNPAAATQLTGPCPRPLPRHPTAAPALLDEQRLLQLALRLVELSQFRVGAIQIQ